MKSKSEIKQTYFYNYNGATFSIDRNFRNDNFLSRIKLPNKNKICTEWILPPAKTFLTLKAAKNFAIKLINEY